jgi:hypothetical protein
LGIAVVSGLASFDSGGTANRVADVFLSDKMTPEAAKPALKSAPQNPHAYITLAPSVLDQYIGHYKLDAGFDADIRKKEGKLMTEVPGQGAQELHPLATNRFFIEQVSGELEFVIKPDSPLRLRFTQMGSTINGERVSMAPWEATNLEQYQGAYWSDELETQYTIKFKDGKLTADHVHHGEIALLPAGQDRFTTKEWFMPEVRFLRDPFNRVSGLTLGGGRVGAVRFNRQAPTGAGTSGP